MFLFTGIKKEACEGSREKKEEKEYIFQTQHERMNKKEKDLVLHKIYGLDSDTAEHNSLNSESRAKTKQHTPFKAFTCCAKSIF